MVKAAEYRFCQDVMIFRNVMSFGLKFYLETGDDAICRPEVRSPRPTTIQDQNLMSHQDGLGHDGTEATGSSKPGNGDNRVYKKSENVAHFSGSYQIEEPQEFKPFVEFAYNMCSIIREVSTSIRKVVGITREAYGVHITRERWGPFEPPEGWIEKPRPEAQKPEKPEEPTVFD